VSPCPQIQEAQGHLVRVRRPAVQHTSVGRLPQVLVLQLQRSRWDTSCLTGPLKVQGHIRFPLELHPADLQVLQPPYLPRSLLQAAAAPAPGPQHLDSHKSSGPPRSSATAKSCSCNTAGDVANCVGSLNADAVSCPCLHTSHGLGFQAGTAACGHGAPVDSNPGAKDYQQPPHGLQNCSCCSYSLRAVMVHLGGGGGGHWLTYRRGITHQNCKGTACISPAVSNWFRVSDRSVTAVSEVEVLASQACALVYQRHRPQDSKDTK